MSKSLLHKMSPRVEFILTRVFPLLLVATGAITFFHGTCGLIRASRSSGWPMSNGKVVSSSVKCHHNTNKEDETSSTYYGNIRYKFTVDSKACSGDRIAYGDYGSSNTKHASAIVRCYPQGKEVTVYYMPGNPKECLLEPGVKGQTLLRPGLGLVFLLAGSLLAVFLPGIYKKRGWGNFRVKQ